jgi:hypothetical protein
MSEPEIFYFIHNRLAPGRHSRAFETYEAALSQVRDDFRGGRIDTVEIMRRSDNKNDQVVASGDDLWQQVLQLRAASP